MHTALIEHMQTAGLLLLPGVAFAAVGYGAAGWPGAALCAAIYSLIAFVVFRSAEREVLAQHDAVYIAEQQAPGLYGLIGELARRAGVRTPALYLLPESAAQLLVTRGSAERATVAVSKGLLQELSREELSGVMAQAISRIRISGVLPMTIAARWAQLLISLSNLFRWSHLLPSRMIAAEKRDGIASDAFLWVLIAPLAAAWIRVTARVSQHFRADDASVRMIGDNHPLREALRYIGAYRTIAPLGSVSPATAHLFISNPLSGSGWTQLFETHPPAAERLARLEALGQRTVHSSAWLDVRHANR